MTAEMSLVDPQVPGQGDDVIGKPSEGNDFLVPMA
jgi:hypothetical protein